MKKKEKKKEMPSQVGPMWLSPRQVVLGIPRKIQYHRMQISTLG